MTKGGEERFLTVYPSYLDCSVSRSKGRRVPKSLCVPNVTVDEIKKACEALGLSFVVEAEKKYPRDWKRSGRVLVEKKWGKAQLLRQIAGTVLKMRGKG